MITHLSQVLILAGTAAFAISLACTLWVKSRARLDTPNHRSSHTRPTPTGGGLGITLCALLCLLALAIFDGRHYLGVAIGIALLAVTSWRDDTHPLSPLLRLLIQLLAASAASLPVFFAGNVNPLWGGAVVIAIMWLINLYNFMDGTDGLASAQGLIFTLGILVLYTGLEPAERIVLVTVAGAISAFLFFNWPPARIFMGDVGSTVLGLLFGCLILQVSDNLNQLAACLILLAGFLTDASWTLTVRLLTRQRIWEAHRLHYYQKMARKFASHRAPLATYLVLGALVQWPLAYGALHSVGWYWIYYLIPAISIHAWLCWHYRAGLIESAEPTAITQSIHQ